MQEVSLEPVLHTVQGVHGDGVDHGYLALVVFEHKYQIHILHVKLVDGSNAQQQKAAYTKKEHTAVWYPVSNLVDRPRHRTAGTCVQ